jgi:DHA1 family tetracycline resistance protein-like MFS transporter
LTIAPYRLLLSQALAFGAERGFPGGGFLLAGILAGFALLILLARVVPKVRRVEQPVSAN